MNKIFLSILFIGFFKISFGQTSAIKYFNNKWLEKEVPKGKARFSETITKTADGLYSVEIRNLKNNEIIESNTYKDGEPYGIWKLQNHNTKSLIDYNFPLIYSSDDCNDKINVINLHLDNDSIKYKAPVMKSDKNFYQFLYRNTFYPKGAYEQNIQGTVFLKVKLTEDGKIDNVTVKRGVYILLDKEAVRIARLLDFETPPTVDGKVLTCFILPVKY